MALLGKTVQLKGISQKGKNRVREQGDRWTCWAETETVLFSPGNKGPWLFVSPVGKDFHDKAARWIKVAGDSDFMIIVLDD